MSTPVVRPARVFDAAAILAIYAPAVIASVISFEEELPSLDELTARMSARPAMPWLVAELDGEVAGYAYASPHRQRAAYRWSADCSVYIAPAYHRQGLGRLLYEHLFATMKELGYITMYAGIALPNDSSVGLHERLGFTRVGVYRNVGFKQGRWLDVGWWTLPLVAELPAHPVEPAAWNRHGSGAPEAREKGADRRD
jgi:L-amino acid N-acyltransferase YncA